MKKWVGMAITFEGVRRIALALNGVAESTSYGTPAFKLGGKLIARLREDSETLVVGTTFEERAELMAVEPRRTSPPITTSITRGC